MYDCVPHTYLVPEEGQRVAAPPELQLQKVESPCGPNLDPVQEQPVLLPAEPSLQSFLKLYLVQFFETGSHLELAT